MSELESGGTGRNRRIIAALAALIAVIVLATWLLWPEDKPAKAVAAPTPTPVAVTATPPPSYCEQAPAKPFTPTRIDVAHVADAIPVLALARDSSDLPSTPPLTNYGKTVFGWDKPPGLKPGSATGNVLLNAHTWPDGSALGNRLLAKLQVDDRIIVKGAKSHLCYRVTKRVEVPANKGYPPYYQDIGSPQIAIIVCSGTRLSARNWTKRTIWFAAPMTTPEVGR